MDFSFMNKIKKGVIPLYTQAINGLRVKEHDVTYVFDEVGCGKTISAIIAMASIIKDDKDECKILVVTPKSVCNQFATEIEDKLELGVIPVINIAFKDGNSLKSGIENIKEKKQIIVVTNPHKVGKLNKVCQWNLVIIDEAHDIICNSQSQTEIYYNFGKTKQSNEKMNSVDEAYKKFCDWFEKECNSIDKNMKKHFENRKKFVEHIEEKEDNCALVKFAKSVTVEEYYKYNDWGQTRIASERRDNTNTIFKDICSLDAKKVMFLTATPYKYDKDFDFVNYALVGTKITTENLIVHKNNFPNMEWISSLYTLSDNGYEKMIKSNSSLMFKEIAQAIPMSGEGKIEGIEGKERKVEIWDEVTNDGDSKNVNNRLLYEKLIGDNGILRDREHKNRVIIFVSNSNEGQLIFEKIFSNEYRIDEDSDHKYTDTKSKISCEFIMNKFGNAPNLEKYSREQEGGIPDILIATWQVAQVGVNLPTYNYVINYHIPPVPGHLEQRYGRIDRLNSKRNPLYNIYYLDNEVSTQVYRVNLIRALYAYKKEIMEIPHNIPVKNFLICKDLKVKMINRDELYNSLAYYIFSYFSVLSESRSEDEQNRYIEELKSNNIEIVYENNKLDIKISSNKTYSYNANSIHVDDEINSNNENDKNKRDTNIENIKKQISSLIDGIQNYENMSKMAKELNSVELGKAGSIIFLNKDQNKVLVINCTPDSGQ